MGESTGDNNDKCIAEPNLELTLSSSYPTISHKYYCHKQIKMVPHINDPKQSRSSFMSNGSVIEQMKFEQYSRHSSIISNGSRGSKSSKI